MTLANVKVATEFGAFGQAVEVVDGGWTVVVNVMGRNLVGREVYNVPVDRVYPFEHVEELPEHVRRNARRFYGLN